MSTTDLSMERRRLVQHVRRQLMGPSPYGSDSAELRGSPLDRYPTGVLYPITPGDLHMPGVDPAGTVQQTPPDDDEEQEAQAGATESADGVARPINRRRYVPPSSVGVSFYVRGEVRLQVTASAARYRAGPGRDVKGQFQARYYEREESVWSMDWPGATAVGPGGTRSEARREADRDGDVVVAVFHENPSAASGANNAQVVQLEIRRREYGDGQLLTAVFANRQEARHPPLEQRCLFETRLECVIVSGTLSDYPRSDPNLLSEDEQEVELQYRNRPVYAIGHGAAADWSEEGPKPRVWCDFMPTVEVPVVTTRTDGPDDALVLHDIVRVPFERTLDRFGAFVDRYENWVQDQWTKAHELGHRDRDAGNRICQRMDAVLDRMRRGVERLRSDSQARQAFQIANEAMLDQMRQRNAIRKSGAEDSRAYRWRSFQLGFLLAGLSPATDGEDPFRDCLDLIWFPTGGGKTEAYLGLFAFVAVWRRLRYGESGGGTAALMRYTLRLLTRQQFERAARIVCALERLRRRDERALGPEPFSLGLWVGQAVSPNTFKEAAQIVEEMAAEGHVADADERRYRLVLRSCPWCGTDFAVPNGYRAGPSEFSFLCRARDCAFGDGHPLPCNVVDEALYQQPPTLLLSTIDKFARLAWEERAANFFGRGGFRPPELVIQDELHLIAGPLGSVAGLYEAALETVIEQRGGRPKYIASTATIRSAREQVRRLYGREELAVFPPPGLSADDSWFAQTDKSRPGRMYVGYLAPRLDQQRCLAPLTAALLDTPVALFGDLPDTDILDAWWTQVIYHGSLRGVGASHIALVKDVPWFLQRLREERRQAQGRAGDEATRSVERNDSDVEIGRTAEAIAQITSRATAQENARTFHRLESRHGDLDCLDTVLVTNMFSVGVDVDRLGLMVVNGQPLTTAEYIQASSRIGRAKAPGIVVANYYRHQARSLSHYENFRPYHEAFYRFVEPTSVTPFTYQVRTRALHAALVIAIRMVCDDLTSNKAAGRFDAAAPGVQAVVDALRRRCRRAGCTKVDAVDAHLDRLAGEWTTEASRCRELKRALHYRCTHKSAESLLAEFDGTRAGLWRTMHSMRSIEDTAVLWTRPARNIDRSRRAPTLGASSAGQDG